MMFAPPYRAAVIGRTGRGDYGHNLDLALLDQPKLTLVAVADEDPAGRAAAAKRLGLDRAYADYREMLEKEKPAFVSVAPRWLDGHRDMITACAEHGVVGIFCEKPLAPDLASCDTIVSACERAHVKLAMAFQTRYSARFDRARELVASGAIGEVLELRGRGKEDRRGGGEDLMVLGSHIVDLMRGFLGDAAWCFARVTEGGKPIGRAQVREGAEGIGPLAGDRIDAMYGFRGSPAVGHFASTRPKEAGARFGLQVCGSTGCLWIAMGSRPPAFYLSDPTWLGTEKRWVEITSGGIGKPETVPANDVVPANRAIVADLIRAVEADEQPRVNVYDGRAAVEMILACYASAARGAAVEMPLTDRARHPLEALGETRA
jgi:predicted dehydrogenase